MDEKDFPLKRYHLARTNDDLKFHRFWEWLMPVVEKIESLDFPYIKVRIEAGFSVISVAKEGENLYGIDKNITCKNKIDSVWISVVEFIKWYNQQKIK